MNPNQEKAKNSKTIFSEIETLKKQYETNFSEKSLPITLSLERYLQFSAEKERGFSAYYSPYRKIMVNDKSKENEQISDFTFPKVIKDRFVIFRPKSPESSWKIQGRETTTQTTEKFKKMPDPFFIESPSKFMTPFSQVKASSQMAGLELTKQTLNEKVVCPAETPKNVRKIIFDINRELDFESDIEDQNNLHPELLKWTSQQSQEMIKNQSLAFMKPTLNLEGCEAEAFFLDDIIGHLVNQSSANPSVINHYICKHCGLGFKDGCGLGGHVSKIHGGLKETPKKKRILKDFKHFDKTRTKFFRTFKK